MNFQKEVTNVGVLCVEAEDRLVISLRTEREWSGPDERAALVSVFLSSVTKETKESWCGRKEGSHYCY